MSLQELKGIDPITMIWDDLEINLTGEIGIVEGYQLISIPNWGLADSARKQYGSLSAVFNLIGYKPNYRG